MRVRTRDVAPSTTTLASIDVLSRRDAFDDEPDAIAFSTAAPVPLVQEPKNCAWSQMKSGEEKLAENIEDVDVI